MSSQSFALASFHHHNIPSILPEHMTRQQLENSIRYQLNLINVQQNIIHEHDLERGDVAIEAANLCQKLEGLYNLHLHSSSRLAEAQRTLSAHKQVIIACRENMKLLGQMLEAREEKIASLRARLAEFVMEQQDENDADDEAEEGKDGEKPISPFQFPSPAFPSDFSSASAAIRPHRASCFRSPTKARATATASRTTKRPRPTPDNSPIESPHDAERNGRPIHRAKRACLQVAGQLGHGSAPPSSSSLSSISSLTCMASASPWWSVGEMSPWDERREEEQEREAVTKALRSLLMSK